MKDQSKNNYRSDPNLLYVAPAIIRSIRFARNHTQRQAARLVGITTGHWGAWEQGHKNMTFSTLMTYCAIQEDDQGFVKSRVYSHEERKIFSDAGVSASTAEVAKLAKKKKK